MFLRSFWKEVKAHNSIPECPKYIRVYFPCNAKQVELPDCIWLEVVHYDRMNNLPFPVVGAEPACDIPANGYWWEQ